MLFDKLADEEDMHCYDNSELPSFSEMYSNKTYVGLLVTPRLKSMSCLLSNGKLLSCLHSVCDLDKYTSKKKLEECYDDLENTHVFFVKGKMIYKYLIKKIIHDGIPTLKQSGVIASTYDYALLELDGDPVGELGGGLEMDDINHYSSLTNSEPRKTLAVSAPDFYRNKFGALLSRRIISISDNLAASSAYYMFAQVGTHRASAGTCGQAIFPLSPYMTPNNILYAIHAGRDSMNGLRFGVKLSEYIQSRRILDRPADPLNIIQTYTHPSLSFLSQLPIEREGLRREGKDYKDITAFLKSLEAYKYDQIDRVTIPPALLPKEYEYADTHQYQHLGGRAAKSRFYSSIGTSDKELVFNVLLNCVNKIVSQFYQENKPHYDAIKTNFIVDLGFDIGEDRKTKNATSCVHLDGFSGTTYHIYPRDITRNLPKNSVVINAHDFLKAHANPVIPPPAYYHK